MTIYQKQRITEKDTAQNFKLFSTPNQYIIIYTQKWIKFIKIVINAGVLQGPYLSPLLFVIYIKDLQTISRVLIHLFADDTMIFVSSMGT